MGAGAGTVAVLEVTQVRRGRPPRSEQEITDQRTRLIDAAMEAIHRNGPDASLAEMAAAASVSKPVLYAAFGDKQGVADAIALTLAGRIESQVVADLTARGVIDLPTMLEAFIDALITLIDSEPDVYAFLVRSIRGTDRGLLENALVRAIHERSRVLIDLIAPGVDRDELDVLTDGVFGFMLGAIESWQSTRRVPKQRLIQMLASALGGGLTSAVSPAP